MRSPIKAIRMDKNIDSLASIKEDSAIKIFCQKFIKLPQLPTPQN